MINLIDNKLLSDWKTDNHHGYNWFRESKNNSHIFIGLDCTKNLGVKAYATYGKYISIETDLKNKNLDIKILRWDIFGSYLFQNHIDLYNKLYDNPKYTFDQLDFAKSNIDNFLLKFENLKVYT